MFYMVYKGVVVYRRPVDYCNIVGSIRFTECKALRRRHYVERQR